MASYSNIDVDVFVPDHSRGLMIDARVLMSALSPKTVRIIPFPFESINTLKEVNTAKIDFEPLGRIAVFVERVFEHKLLDSYERRVLLPNPEWLFDDDLARVNRTVTEFWHKTIFGQRQIEAVFPEKKHIFVGFTSIAPKPGESNYNSCFHVSGLAPNARHTQSLVNVWISRPDFPSLSVRAAWRGILQVPDWINYSNLRLFMGDLSDAAYQNEFTRSGIHICTSQMEGFGHYINEARSIGALIVTVDAPPMTELVKAKMGILIPPERSVSHGLGVRNIINGKSIETAIEKVTLMKVSQREALGNMAREQFIKDQTEFVTRIKGVV